MEIEKIIKIRMIFHDEESASVDVDDLTEFIIDNLNEEYRKDCLTFEEVKYE